MFRHSATIAVLLAVLSASALASDAPGSDPDKNSYSIGYDIGRTLRQQFEGLSADGIARGLKDGLSGTAPALAESEMQQRLAALQQDAARRIPERNRKEGEAFLARNKKGKGVKTTASGLQYKVIKAGKGAKPGLQDTVTVHYRGTLINGTEFDSSYKRGQPATFPVKGVIAGWTEALQLMPAGSKWMLYIPSGLAYGERGAGHLIGPNSTLIFEVELLSANKASP